LKVLRKITSARFALFTVLFALLCTFSFSEGHPAPVLEPDFCSNVQDSPKLKKLLETNYASWMVQTKRSLSKTAALRWSAQKALGCPGAIEGEFLPDGAKAYVLLLVSRERSDGGYLLVMVKEVAGQDSRPEIVETSERAGSSSYFLQKVRTSAYFNPEKTKKFKPQAEESFLVFDAAEQEYGVDLYFWSEGRFESSPVDE
jgi:hypothetical protein